MANTEALINVEKLRRKAYKFDEERLTQKAQAEDQANQDYAKEYQEAKKQLKEQLLIVEGKLDQGIEKGEKEVLIGDLTTSSEWSRNYTGREDYCPEDQVLLDALKEVGLRFEVRDEESYDMCDTRITKHNLYVYIPGRKEFADDFDPTK